MIFFFKYRKKNFITYLFPANSSILNSLLSCDNLTTTCSSFLSNGGNLS